LSTPPLIVEHLTRHVELRLIMQFCSPPPTVENEPSAVLNAPPPTADALRFAQFAKPPEITAHLVSKAPPICLIELSLPPPIVEKPTTDPTILLQIPPPIVIKQFEEISNRGLVGVAPLAEIQLLKPPPITEFALDTDCMILQFPPEIVEHGAVVKLNPPPEMDERDPVAQLLVPPPIAEHAVDVLVVPPPMNE
jgi:hypothetical protein